MKFREVCGRVRPGFEETASQYHRNKTSQAEAKKARNIHMARTEPKRNAVNGILNALAIIGVVLSIIGFIAWLT